MDHAPASALGANCRALEVVAILSALGALAGCGGISFGQGTTPGPASAEWVDGPAAEGAGIRVVPPPGLVRLASPLGVLGLGPRETPIPVPAGVPAMFLTALSFAEPIPAGHEACAIVLGEGAAGADAGRIGPARTAIGPPGMTACEAEGTAPPEAGRTVVYAALVYAGERGVMVIASAPPSRSDRFFDDVRLSLPTIELLPGGSSTSPQPLSEETETPAPAPAPDGGDPSP